MVCQTCSQGQLFLRFSTSWWLFSSSGTCHLPRHSRYQQDTTLLPAALSRPAHAAAAAAATSCPRPSCSLPRTRGWSRTIEGHWTAVCWGFCCTAATARPAGAVPPAPRTVPPPAARAVPPAPRTVPSPTPNCYLPKEATHTQEDNPSGKKFVNSQKI